MPEEFSVYFKVPYGSDIISKLKERYNKTTPSKSLNFNFCKNSTIIRLIRGGHSRFCVIREPTARSATKSVRVVIGSKCTLTDCPDTIPITCARVLAFVNFYFPHDTIRCVRGTLFHLYFEEVFYLERWSRVSRFIYSVIIRQSHI